MTENINNKTCSKCRQIKSIHDFSLNRKMPDGREYYCKDCRKDFMQVYRSNTVHLRYQKRQYHYYNNADKYREKTRKYNEKIKKENPALFRAKKFFSNKFRKAVDKEVTVDFLYNLLISTPNCQCCGIELDLNYGQKGNLRVPSIDRVRNEIGYTKDNIGVICWRCNLKKTDLTISDLEQIINYIKNNSKCVKNV